ncbi:MAG: 7-carboxy-7-deazaguanine synthase QueE [Pirellulaceae bacterium]|nr:7-carboxy-7-deazaguanine synthase QueE [Pirellulaceae bacterium]
MTGTDSFFVRTSGCNLRCWFCDTPYASWNPSGEQIPLDQIVQQAVDSGRNHVVLTGGEPMLPRESVSLCRMLQEASLHVTVETAGTIDRDLHCDLMSISPKFRSSAPDAREHPHWNEIHRKRRLPIDVMRRLIDRSPSYQLKFVVDSPEDYDEVVEIAEELKAPANEVWIMPQGSTIEAMDAAIAWLKPWALQNGFRYCDRMQIRWFGNRRGT